MNLFFYFFPIFFYMDIFFFLDEIYIDIIDSYFCQSPIIPMQSKTQFPLGLLHIFCSIFYSFMCGPSSCNLNEDLRECGMVDKIGLICVFSWVRSIDFAKWVTCKI